MQQEFHTEKLNNKILLGLILIMKLCLRWQWSELCIFSNLVIINDLEIRSNILYSKNKKQKNKNKPKTSKKQINKKQAKKINQIKLQKTKSLIVLLQALGTQI